MKIFNFIVPLFATQYGPAGGQFGGLPGGYRPNQRNAFIQENNAIRKVSMHEHGKNFCFIRNLTLKFESCSNDKRTSTVMFSYT